ncbi:MAG: D-alanine--D-alanine ligase [Candidatus Omnitrophica bacterium]|nr:D-alanine--D-alanine ligase [Candidatus Omnitrophota bacterium]MDD5592303.1 D-alanine--D-alanine ligase [Candidatus Omnitrophota bacterium]
MALSRKLQNRFGRIGVLMGGPSTEREISLKSGQAVCDSLSKLGFKVAAIDIKTDNIKKNTRLIKSYRIGLAFVALHGRFGEDGQIQELLDSLKIPYTGSGAMASCLAMDKITSRKIFEAHGLYVPRYKVEDRFSYNRNWKMHNMALSLPLVVKPATHGSSIGLSIIDTKSQLDKAVGEAFSFDEKVIIEEYIEGRELTVGILEEKALPVIEIVPKKRFFDYQAKYQAGMTEYIIPAKLQNALSKKIQEAALCAHKLLGCFGCSRVDMILSEDNMPFILEINTIPGLTQTSLLPKAARIVGIDFPHLCLKLIKLAYEKAKNKSSG